MPTCIHPVGSSSHPLCMVISSSCSPIPHPPSSSSHTVWVEGTFSTRTRKMWSAAWRSWAGLASSISGDAWAFYENNATEVKKANEGKRNEQELGNGRGQGEDGGRMRERNGKMQSATWEERKTDRCTTKPPPSSAFDEVGTHEMNENLPARRESWLCWVFLSSCRQEREEVASHLCALHKLAKQHNAWDHCCCILYSPFLFCFCLLSVCLGCHN